MSKKVTLRRVAYSVGGAKGAVYPGTSKALADLGVLTDIDKFAGGSAGSIIAAFMAIGMPLASFCQAIYKAVLIGAGINPEKINYICI